MRLLKLTSLCLFLIGMTGARCLAQDRNEIALSVGAGSLQVDPGGGATAVFSLSYQLHITRHFSGEGALDSFNYTFQTGPSQGTYKDGYLGAEAAIVYDFLPNSGGTTAIRPFVAAGIGKTTTDFTEIAAHPYYRLGAGISYRLTNRYGLRIEF